MTSLVRCATEATASLPSSVRSRRDMRASLFRPGRPRAIIEFRANPRNDADVSHSRDRVYVTARSGVAAPLERELVPRTGFEPVISALRGRPPNRQTNAAHRHFGGLFSPRGGEI